MTCMLSLQGLSGQSGGRGSPGFNGQSVSSTHMQRSSYVLVHRSMYCGILDWKQLLHAVDLLNSTSQLVGENTLYT